MRSLLGWLVWKLLEVLSRPIEDELTLESDEVIA